MAEGGGRLRTRGEGTKEEVRKMKRFREGEIGGRGGVGRGAVSRNRGGGPNLGPWEGVLTKGQRVLNSKE